MVEKGGGEIFKASRRSTVMIDWTYGNDNFEDTGK